MKEMLEAAKFYRECIKDVQKSLMMEIQQDDNSLVNFSAKMFESPSAGFRTDVHIVFTLNEKEIYIDVLDIPKDNSSKTIALTKKVIADRLASEIAHKVLMELK